MGSWLGLGAGLDVWEKRSVSYPTGIRTPDRQAHIVAIRHCYCGTIVTQDDVKM
jgi:hypothetical protein